MNPFASFFVLSVITYPVCCGICACVYSREVFLSFEEILGTLIHEITHIKISPHSAEFYKLMEDLYAEVEKDMAAGLTAVGTLNYVAFSGTAHRLGCSTGNV